MTEKAAVEVPAPVSGRVVSTTGQPGDMVPVGSELLVLETEARGAQASPSTAVDAGPGAAAPAATATPAAAPTRSGGNGAHAAREGGRAAEAPRGARVATSPAIRRRAHEAGVDLRQVLGSGPSGRIVSKDLEAHVARASQGQPVPLRPAPRAVSPAKPQPRAGAATEEIKVIGVRRLIA